jgi:hypothetical protein
MVVVDVRRGRLAGGLDVPVEVDVEPLPLDHPLESPRPCLVIRQGIDPGDLLREVAVGQALQATGTIEPGEKAFGYAVLPIAVEERLDQELEQRI